MTYDVFSKSTPRNLCISLIFFSFKNRVVFFHVWLSLCREKARLIDFHKRKTENNHGNREWCRATLSLVIFKIFAHYSEDVWKFGTYSHLQQDLQSIVLADLCPNLVIPKNRRRREELIYCFLFRRMWPGSCFPSICEWRGSFRERSWFKNLYSLILLNISLTMIYFYPLVLLELDEISPKIFHLLCSFIHSFVPTRKKGKILNILKKLKHTEFETW